MFDEYMVIFKNLYPDRSVDIKYNIQAFQRKILKHNELKLLICPLSKGKKIVFSNSMTLEDAKNKLIDDDNRDLKNRIKSVAFQLRQIIVDTKSTPLPTSGINLAHIFKGEMEVPEELMLFYTYLINGPSRYPCEETEDTAQSKIRIKSMAQDAIFNVTRGKVRPTKHLQLGIAIKSMTGSRKLMEICNRLGQSISYTVCEEIETELIYTATDFTKKTPYGIVCDSSYCTGLAWDNYDAFVDTANGKGTMHDTVGICYQYAFNEEIGDVGPINNSEYNVTDLNAIPLPLSRKRRFFEAPQIDIEPYRKKPRVNAPQLISIDNIGRQLIPNNYRRIQHLDRLWIICLANKPDKTPMWNGFNAKVLTDNLPQHRISYMPQINESPTSLSVVRETLKTSLKVADECHQDFMVVTYDLAIAKMAFQLQLDEAPEFDRIFITLGDFHTKMAFLKAIGKFFDESGGSNILVESGIIAQGSINGIITATHFNRSSRIHNQLAAAFEILHYKQFCTHNNYDELLSSEDLNILENGVSCNLEEVQLSNLLINHIESYMDYSIQTEQGLHGKTAQYWFLYVKYLHMYREFSRAVSTGDLQLLISTLPKLAGVFFAFNQPNYARWILYYHSNLLNIDITHIGLKHQLQNGMLYAIIYNFFFKCKLFFRLIIHSSYQEKFFSNSN